MSADQGSDLPVVEFPVQRACWSLLTVLWLLLASAVNQDPLGKQGVLKKGNASEPVQLYARELEGGALAVAVFNRGDENVTNLRVNWSDLGLPAGKEVRPTRTFSLATHFLIKI